MTNATFAVYEASTHERRAAPLRRFVNARVRDALGYTPWAPPTIAPPIAQPVAAAPRGLLASIARAAVALRPTMLGRILFRLTPMVFVTALKARLR